MALRVGILGAGAIAPPYYAAIAAWPQLALVACSSRTMTSARACAEKYGLAAVGFDELLADPAIDVVVNLTPAQAHFETSLRILQAGKHLYSEKPLATRFADGATLLAAAAERGLRIGCAPDTFMGSAHQQARAAIDSGAIGVPVAGAAFLGSPGVERWHPHPEPFYAAGGGPVADHAPYYLTQLVNLLGPVASVVAQGTMPSSTRTLHNPARAGEIIPVEVLTTANAVLGFGGGASVTMTMSWDIARHQRAPIEIYGSLGTLLLPDPNWSDGEVRLLTGDGGSSLLDHSHRPFHDPTMITFQGPSVGYYRLCGLADMADAIAQGRPHRAGAELALHVLEVIEAIRIAAETGARVPIGSRCARPEPVRDDIAHAAGFRPFGKELLDARTLF